jgi:hypothetical protein
LGDEGNMRGFLRRYSDQLMGKVHGMDLLFGSSPVYGAAVPAYGGADPQPAGPSGRGGPAPAGLTYSILVDGGSLSPVNFSCVPGDARGRAAFEGMHLERGRGIGADNVMFDVVRPSAADVGRMFDSGLHFIVRLSPGDPGYSPLAGRLSHNVFSPSDLVGYGSGLFMVKACEAPLFGRPARAYVGSDPPRRAGGGNRRPGGPGSRKAASGDPSGRAAMILLSSTAFHVYHALPLYFASEALGRYFGLADRILGLITPEGCGAGALRGSLFLSFLAAVAYSELDRLLLGSGHDAASALKSLPLFKAYARGGTVIPDAVPEDVRAIAGYLGISLPPELKLPL